VKTIIGNDIKKGTKLRLKNGWSATMMDNRRGSIRTMRVDGYVTDTGDQYIWKVSQALIDDEWCKLVLTNAQIRQKNRIEAFMGAL